MERTTRLENRGNTGGERHNDRRSMCCARVTPGTRPESRVGADALATAVRIRRRKSLTRSGLFVRVTGFRHIGRLTARSEADRTAARLMRLPSIRPQPLERGTHAAIALRGACCRRGDPGIRHVAAVTTF